MTRENKIALIVGFGLVLLVGILISDHLANARSAEPPDLTPVDATDDTLGPELRLVDLSGRAEVAPGPEPVSLEVQASVSAPDARPEPATLPAATTLPNVHAESGDRLHRIESGQTLAGICRHYYDDPALAGALADYNALHDPDRVAAGRTLRVPPRHALVHGSPAAPAAAAPQKPTTTGTYTVKPDETLSEIAQRVLGSARRWEELFELNRDRIDDPDAVRAGVVLRLPARG
jgi:nucleoid-associated protein YgaU